MRSPTYKEAATRIRHALSAAGIEHPATLALVMQQCDADAVAAVAIFVERAYAAGQHDANRHPPQPTPLPQSGHSAE